MELERLRTLIRSAGGTQANPYVDQQYQVNAALPPSSLRAVSSVGVTRVEWEASLSRDIRYYIIEFSPDSGFTNQVFTYTTQALGYTFHVGESGIVYYARVRTLLASGALSVWSATLNTVTGFATTEDMAPYAASAFFLLRDETPRLLSTVYAGYGGPATVTTTYGPLDVTLFGGLAFPSCLVRGEIITDGLLSTSAPYVSIEFLRNGVRVGDAYNAPVYSPGALYQFSATGFTPPDDAGSGDHEYTVKITVNNEDVVYADCTINLLELQLMELKR